jgi:hypothetical protein
MSPCQIREQAQILGGRFEWYIFDYLQFLGFLRHYLELAHFHKSSAMKGICAISNSKGKRNILTMVVAAPLIRVHRKLNTVRQFYRL